MLKFILILSSLGLTGAGLMGPTVFVESMGKLNLFELTQMSKDSLYFWIGVAFAGIIALSVLATVFRIFAGVWWLAILGITLWSVSYYFFREWHDAALANLSNIKISDGVENKSLQLMIKNLKLEWGAYSIVSGMGLMAVFSMLRRG